MNDPRGTIEYYVKFIKIAVDGFLAMSKTGGELLDKREHSDEDNVVLFEKDDVINIVNNLADDITKAANSL